MEKDMESRGILTGHSCTNSAILTRQEQCYHVGLLCPDALIFPLLDFIKETE